jgi:branched-chain amino acid transport system substrate-binding protein
MKKYFDLGKWNLIKLLQKTKAKKNERGKKVRVYITVIISFLTFSLAGLVKLTLAMEPIKIGIIAEEGTAPGMGIVNGAKLAVNEINTNGGINGRPIKLIIYDDHIKATEAVQEFQRLVTNDHVVAVVGSWVSEIALALEPWAARLHTVYITTGAASDQIPYLVHKNYEEYKYVFMTWLNSFNLAQSVCDFTKDVLVKQFHYNTAFILSEDAAWTQSLDKAYLECLPKAGVRVVGHLRYAPNTVDFAPIFQSINQQHPDMIVTGIAHSGLTATVQWHNNKEPFLFTGVISVASSPSYWKETGGACNGLISQAGTSDSPLTPKTQEFAKKYYETFKILPPYTGYVAYDTLYILANAIKRAKSTNTDALIKALEATNYIGVMGHIEFYPPSSPFAHNIRYGKNFVVSPAIQWQNGKIVTIWPPHAATAKVIIPSFVKK